MHKWVVNTLKMMDRLPAVEPPDVDQTANTMDAEIGEILPNPPQH
jgi:hypothetical protein